MVRAKEAKEAKAKAKVYPEEAERLRIDGSDQLEGVQQNLLSLGLLIKSGFTFKMEGEDSLWMYAPHSRRRIETGLAGAVRIA